MTKNYKLFFLTLILLPASCMMALAQIPNAGFENWHSQGFPAYTEPDSWGTLNGATNLISVYTVEKATAGADVHSGTAAIKLTTKYISFANATAPGAAVTGTINTNTQELEGGFPYTGRPIKIRGWFKGTPAASDTNRVEVYLFKRQGATQITVGDATFINTANVTTYTQFEATINYYTSDIPDTARIVLWSSAPNNPVQNSVFYVDDLAFIDCAGFSVSAAGTATTHLSGTDGSAVATVSGGASPYTYLWSTAATSATIINLTQGNYCVTATDNNGCTATACAQVNDPTCTGFSASVTTQNTSGSDTSDGSAQVTATGGHPAYTYAWTTGGTSASLTSLASGNYCVTVTDNAGCTATACGIVSSPSCTNFAVSVATSNVTMVGGSNGSATATPANGTSPYSYVWNTTASSSSISGLQAGTYCVTVSDNAGCIASACGTVNQPDCSSFTLSLAASNATTVGGSDGSVIASPAGGTSPYTYFWNNLSTSQGLLNEPAGIYCVTATDAVGCILTGCDTVNNPTCTGLQVTLTVTNASSASSNDGSIASSVSGGTSPYTYLWNTGATTATLPSLGGGSYCLTVSDAALCTVTLCDTVDAGTGIADLAWSRLQFYPNPANNTLTVHKTTEHDLQLIVLTLDGKTVAQSTLRKAEEQLSIDNLANGLYLCRFIDTEGSMVTHKLQILH